MADWMHDTTSGCGVATRFHCCSLFHGFGLSQLAVLNIADHFTRVNVGNAPGTTPSRVFGLLFGTQDGRNADICSSVEILCTHADGKYTIRQDIMETSMKLCTFV
jgi:hypothetical protein